jgi:hypothetical protein
MLALCPYCAHAVACTVQKLEQHFLDFRDWLLKSVSLDSAGFQMSLSPSGIGLKIDIFFIYLYVLVLDHPSLYTDLIASGGNRY